MMSYVFLDDVRDPITYGESFKVKDRAAKILEMYGRNNWIWVKTIEAAKPILERGGVDTLSCDNDLGDGIKEGHELLNWLEEKAFTDPNFPIPDHIYVHSHNIDRIAPMQITIDRIKQIRGK
jgi:hypothetical protein